MQLNFDANNVAPNTAPEPVETGSYLVCIVGAEEKPTKANDGSSFLELVLEVKQGPMQGKRVIDRLNLNNKNPQTQEIAYGQLSAIAHVIGRKQLQHSQQLLGGMMTVYVVKEPRNDRPGEYSNTVKGYKDVNGNDPQFGGQQGQGQHAGGYNGGQQQQNFAGQGQQNQNFNGGQGQNNGGQFQPNNGGQNFNGGGQNNGGWQGQDQNNNGGNQNFNGGQQNNGGQFQQNNGQQQNFNGGGQQNQNFNNGGQNNGNQNFNGNNGGGNGPTSNGTPDWANQ